MDDEITRRFLAEVDAFATETVAPEASAWSLGASPEPRLFREAATLGLTGVEVPAALGGRGLGFGAKARASAALAAADFGFAMSIVNTHNVAKRIADSAEPGVARAVLPRLLDGSSAACTAITEPSAGSDVAAMRCTARRTATGWVLDGEKTWIINARRAELAIVYAQTAEPGDAAGIAAFLVDPTAPGCTRYALDSAFSQTSTGTGGFVFSACEVPDNHLLLSPGTAFKAILNEINGARVYVAAMCCAMVAASLRAVRTYGRTRETFGRPLERHPVWRSHVARAATELAAASALVDQAIVAIETGASAQHIAAAAKLQAVAMCQAHLPALLHANGAEGLRPQHPFTRHIAASHVAALTDGSSDMLRDRLGHWDPTAATV